MKILFLFIVGFTLSITTKAQLDKGTWLVGGSGSFKKYKRDFQTPTATVFYKDTRITISPSVGYFLADKFVLGLVPSYTKEKSFSTGFIGNASGGYGDYERIDFGAFSRYYFLKKESNYNLLMDVSYAYNIVRNSRSKTGNGYNYKLMVGPEFFLNSSVGIEILLGYSANKQKTYTGFDYNVNDRGFLTSVGFQFHLEKK